MNSPPPPAVTTAFRCRVAARAALRASAEELSRLRRDPELALPAALLKHAPEQTVAALIAVRQAIARRGWAGRCFADWGVVAAPNFFGRQSMADAMRRYAQEGPWGIAPQLIPHQSLHAVSGTVSQVLKMHGPNFGIGGGPNACNDAFLVAAALLSDGSLPGLWLLLTGHATEWLPGETGQTLPPPCEAAALALVPDGEEGLSLRLYADEADELPGFALSAFVDALTASDEPPAASWRLPGGGWVEIDAEARP